MNETLIEKSADAGLESLGERIGETGVRQLREIARKAQAQRASSNNYRRGMLQAAFVALLIGGGLYTAWSCRKNPA